jgi:hypothetical protein
MMSLTVHYIYSFFAIKIVMGRSRNLHISTLQTVTQADKLAIGQILYRPAIKLESQDLITLMYNLNLNKKQWKTLQTSAYDIQ